VGKSKLGKFAEMNTFKNVFQPSFEEIFQKDFRLKTKWHDYFGNDHPIILELGCGKGEYTTGLAAAYPDKNFIGVDIKGSRMWTGAKYALQNNLGNVVFLRTRIEFTGSFFGKDEIREIWLTFPDPQLKRKRKKKRLMAASFLNMYRTFLINNGLIHLKTDNTVLYEYARSLAVFNNLHLVETTTDLYGPHVKSICPDIKTFYENNYLNDNRKICYLVFRLQNMIIRELPDDTADMNNHMDGGTPAEWTENFT